MLSNQLKKIAIVFGVIFAVCLVYSLLSKSTYERFENAGGLAIKACKADKDCPDKFMCKEAKCVYNRPLP